MNSVTRKCSCLAIIIMLPACYRTGVSGVVRNIRGEALPGVVVQVSDEERQAITDARGHYRITPSSSDAMLNFSKTGYAPARLRLDPDTRRQATHGDVQMWQLPESAGVYLLDDHRYRQMSWVIPRQFFMSDGTVAYGTRSDPAAETHTSEPMIMSYRTPRYDARLSRLVRAKPMQSAAKEAAFDIWTAGGTIDADLVPVDQPQGMLRWLRIDRSLEPGAYAVHWGALEGYITLENRIFMFRVSESQKDAGTLVTSTDLSPATVVEDLPVLD